MCTCILHIYVNRKCLVWYFQLKYKWTYVCKFVWFFGWGCGFWFAFLQPGKDNCTAKTQRSKQGVDTGTELWWEMTNSYCCKVNRIVVLILKRKKIIVKKDIKKKNPLHWVVTWCKRGASLQNLMRLHISAFIITHSLGHLAPVCYRVWSVSREEIKVQSRLSFLDQERGECHRNENLVPAFRENAFWRDKAVHSLIKSVVKSSIWEDFSK